MDNTAGPYRLPGTRSGVHHEDFCLVGRQRPFLDSLRVPATDRQIVPLSHLMAIEYGMVFEVVDRARVKEFGGTEG